MSTATLVDSDGSQSVVVGRVFSAFGIVLSALSSVVVKLNRMDARRRVKLFSPQQNPRARIPHVYPTSLATFLFSCLFLSRRG